MEGAIPDLTSKRVQDKELVPNLANGDFYKALDQTTDVLMALAKGEYDHQTYDKVDKQKEIIKVIAVLFFIILFVIIFAKKGGGGQGGSGGKNDGLWFAAGAILGSMANGGRSGGFGGSAGGGGFGVFGGWGFGGGGSGGSW